MWEKCPRWRCSWGGTTESRWPEPFTHRLWGDFLNSSTSRLHCQLPHTVFLSAWQPTNIFCSLAFSGFLSGCDHIPAWQFKGHITPDPAPPHPPRDTSGIPQTHTGAEMMGTYSISLNLVYHGSSNFFTLITEATPTRNIWSDFCY